MVTSHSAARVVCAIVVTLLSPQLACAQVSALASVTEVDCDFSIVSTGTWDKDGSVSSEITKSDLSLSYRDINTQDGTAEAVGSTGDLYIVVRYVAGNLHFMIINSSGPIYLTTVFNSSSRDGKFKAVHSRHEFTPVSLPGFTSRPEQYIGECEIVK